MHVAVCLSGHMRTYHVTHPTFLRYVVQFVRNWHIDYFIHTWDQLGWLSHDNGRVHDGGITGMPIEEHVEAINQLYKPKAMVIEAEKRFDLSLYEADRRKLFKPGSKGIHIPSMYYKIKACNDLRLQYEKDNNVTYDAVLRLRPDAHFEHPAVFVKTPLKLRSLVMPLCGHFGGVNDMFAFGKPQVMDVYAACFDHLEEYIRAGCEVRPETLLMYHLRKNRIPLDAVETSFSIVRANGSKMLLTMPWLATPQGRLYAREIR